MDIPAVLSPTGKRLRKTTGTKDKRIAEKIRTQVEERHLNAIFGRKAIKPRKDFQTAYLAHCKASMSSRSCELIEEIVPRILDECSWPPLAEELRCYWQGRIEHKKRAVKPITINKERRTLHAALAWAVAEEYILENPTSHVAPWKVKKEDMASVEWFTFAEVSSILERFHEKYHPLVHWSLATGMRLSECLRLTWKDIGISVRILGKSGERFLPVSKPMQEILGGLDQNQARLFPFDRHAVSLAWRKAIKDAKVNKGHWHALRDTAAVWMLQAGVSIYQVSKILGHSSVQVTERYYAHMPQEDLKAALDLVTLSDLDRPSP